MRRRYIRASKKRHRTHKRRNAASRRVGVDAVKMGAQAGGLLGLALLAYALVGDRIPSAALAVVSPGFAISLAIVFLVTSLALYFWRQSCGSGRERLSGRWSRTGYRHKTRR